MLEGTIRFGLVMIVVASLSITGCTAAGPEFVDEGASYDARTIMRILDEHDAGSLTEANLADVSQLRQAALAELRQEGPEAAEAASVITSTFPSDMGGVPYYVEKAKFDGTPAWVLLEARGRDRGALGERALWVLSPRGDVLFASRR